MMTYMDEDTVRALEQEHFQVHSDIDRCFADDESWPCRTIQLIESHRALVRRLWPDQGHGYDNEVERQRVVIDELIAMLHAGRGEWGEY